MNIYITAFLKSWKEIIELLGLLFSVNIVFKSNMNLMSYGVIIIIIISVILTFISILRIFSDVNANAYRSELDINKYMYEWLNNNKRAIIFSRDMSWANRDEKIIHTLIKKAKDNELTLILAKRTSLVKRLEEEGAEFINYSHLGYIPKARFTFVNFGSMDEKVAVGKKDENNIHRITEYVPADGPIYYLARDLVSIMMKLGSDLE